MGVYSHTADAGGVSSSSVAEVAADVNEVAEANRVLGEEWHDDCTDDPGDTAAAVATAASRSSSPRARALGARYMWAPPSLLLHSGSPW